MLKKYKVVVALSYEIEAEDEAEALDWAEKLFVEDIEGRKLNELKKSIFIQECLNNLDEEEKQEADKNNEIKIKIEKEVQNVRKEKSL